MDMPHVQELQLSVTGRVRLELRDEHGNLKQVEEVNNLVTTAGKNHIASRIKDASATAMTHVGVGTNSTAAVIGDTTLNTEIGTRDALDSTTVSTNTVTYVSTFAAGNATGTLVEAGLFNASAAGTMLARTIFTAIPKGAGDTLTITWVLTIA